MTEHGFLDALCSQLSPGRDRGDVVHAGEAEPRYSFSPRRFASAALASRRFRRRRSAGKRGRLCAAGATIDHAILEMDRSELPLISARCCAT